MKKISKILFAVWIMLMIPIICSSQIDVSSWQFKKDKQLHVFTSAGITQGTFSYVNHKTNDYKLAFRSSVMINTCAAFGKEMFDSFSGKQFSGTDFLYSFTSGLLTSYINRGIQKRKQRKEKKEYIEFEFNPALVKK